MKNWTMSESFLTKENKIKELSVELRQQRAKNRQLKSELISLQENIKTSEEENMATNESKAVRIKITKQQTSKNSKNSRGKKFYK